jgi:NAD(P)-dependent dehydrogenase (short-subunit alcohol dehydrogenase family)
MPKVLIVGANRGIGLEFARQYAADGCDVIATCRDHAGARTLEALGPRVSVHALDITDLAAIAQFGRELADETIDVCVVNAGVMLGKGLAPEAVSQEHWTQSFLVNAVGPIACAAAFVRQVARSRERKLLAMSSLVASVGSNDAGGHYPYRASKTALNALWRSFAVDHPEIIAVMVSPGRVQTDMTEFKGDFSAEQAATNVRRIVQGLSQADSGRFFYYDGQPLPW